MQEGKGKKRVRRLIPFYSTSEYRPVIGYKKAEVRTVPITYRWLKHYVLTAENIWINFSF